jgi:signal transduction histidine kinase
MNLAAVIDLRGATAGPPRETVDLRTVVESVVASRESIARAAGVTLDLAPPDGTARLPAGRSAPLPRLRQSRGQRDSLQPPRRPRPHRAPRLRAGSAIFVARRGQRPRRDRRRIHGLTANKRFRGDEATNRRPGSRGLGLALTREIADRFGLQLDLRRPTAGGFEAELATRIEEPDTAFTTKTTSTRRFLGE